MVIRIADIMEYPGLRNCNISDDSGEEFYHSYLNKAFYDVFEKKENLVIDLDGTAGYASSFLDEAFGNLVYDFTLENVKKYVSIKSSEEPHWKSMIETKTFIEWEKRRREGKRPTVTQNHLPWYRIQEGVMERKVWEIKNDFND